MLKRVRTLLIVLFGLTSGMAMAQSAPQGLNWIQVQALPSQSQAIARIQRFEREFENVVGFAIGGGWNGVALGPYDRATGLRVLQDLKSQLLIPSDAFLANGRQYRSQFWPQDGTIPVINIIPGEASIAAAPAPRVDQPELVVTETTTPIIAEETRDEALRSERALSRQEKRDLQVALRWAGTYQGAIDGAYGRGTRRSMAQWQADNGYEETGVMTTAQRAQLFAAFNAVLNSLALQTIDDTRSGIRIAVPTAFVGDPVYDAPFVRFEGKEGAGAELILISQVGGQDRLAALYEVLQTLEIFPEAGKRSLRNGRFTIEGSDDAKHSVGFAQTSGSSIKGAILMWPAGDEERRTRAWQEITASFAAIDGVLEDAYFLEIGENPVDLVAGLEVRQPRFVQSGFFADDRGRIITANTNLGSCKRIEVADGEDATVVAQNDHVVALDTEFPLSPLSTPFFQSVTPRTPAQVMVAGYSHGGLLGAPTVTFGRLEANSDLSGNTDRARMKLKIEDSDIGGPVFDRGGAILGVLLAQPDANGSIPPADLNHTMLWGQMTDVLNKAGISPQTTDMVADMDPIDLSAIARDTAVLVKCWD